MIRVIASSASRPASRRAPGCARRCACVPDARATRDRRRAESTRSRLPATARRAARTPGRSRPSHRRTPRACRHVAGLDHRARDLRPADRAASAGCASASSAARSIGTPSSASRAAMAVHALDAGPPLRGEERRRASASAGFEEVAEHVHVAAVLDGGDLDARRRPRCRAPRRAHAPRRPRRSCRDRSPPSR